MSTPSLQDLLGFEKEFEPAFIALLQKSATPGEKIFAEFSDKEKKTPYIESSLRDMKPAERIHLLEGGGEIIDLWRGLLINRVCTSRGENSDQQAELVGWVRVAAAEVAMGELEMPYHRVVSILSGVSPRGFDPETGLDFTEVQHSISIEIHPRVWKV